MEALRVTFATMKVLSVVAGTSELVICYILWHFRSKMSTFASVCYAGGHFRSKWTMNSFDCYAKALYCNN